MRCFRYHKGTDFQANHNDYRKPYTKEIVVLDTTKVQIFKQITTASKSTLSLRSCFRYHKGTDFQANHNKPQLVLNLVLVVLDTTKVQIFKQITTLIDLIYSYGCCFRYHKGTDFQANHNKGFVASLSDCVVLDTTKVQIFKQITTATKQYLIDEKLF